MPGQLNDSASGRLLDSEAVWRQRARALQLEVGQIRRRLLDAEAGLAERLASIDRFESRLRTVVGPLVDRLDAVQAEISVLRAALRRGDLPQDDGDLAGSEGVPDDGPEWSDYAAGQNGEHAGFRYRETDPRPTFVATLTARERQLLKSLYRRLARRFHPDFAADERERPICTALMMRINAAYAAADIAALQEIERMPAPFSFSDRGGAAHQSFEELAAILAAELKHCRRRLDEIDEELARLDRHQSSMLLRRARVIEAEGRDYILEISARLRARLVAFQAERDSLAGLVRENSLPEEQPLAESLADAIYDLGLEHAFDQDDYLHDFERRRRGNGNLQSEEDLLYDND